MATSFHERFRHKQNGFSIVELIILGGVVVIVVLAFQMLVNRESATQRDLERLATMRQTEIVFQTLYRETGSYRSAAVDGCDEAGDLLESCSFRSIGLTHVAFRDPGNTSYRVTTPPTDTDFAITFELERSYGSLAAGPHTLSSSGIQ